MNKFGKFSIVLASLVLPVSLVVSGLISWHLKSTNPDSVDITLGLAYLRPVLIASLSTYAFLWLAGLVCSLLGLKKDESTAFSKLGLLLLVLVAIFSITASALNSASDKAVDHYRETQSLHQ